MVKQRTHNPLSVGSIPTGRTNKKRKKMHSSALEMAKSFFGVYSGYFDKDYSVVEIGSKDFTEIKNMCNTTNYTGIDLEKGENVNVVLTDPYSIPLGDNSVDIIVSTSCFEHVPMFWLLFLEGIRILKPNGLFYINAPSAGVVHRFPVDCWRFYPDSSNALVSWAKRNGYNSVSLESFIYDNDPTWKDCVSVILKDEQFMSKYERRICDGGNFIDICCNR